jgi:hypothetical protein
MELTLTQRPVERQASSRSFRGFGRAHANGCVAIEFSGLRDRPFLGSPERFRIAPARS